MLGVFGYSGWHQRQYVERIERLSATPATASPRAPEPSDEVGFFHPASFGRQLLGVWGPPALVILVVVGDGVRRALVRRRSH